MTGLPLPSQSVIGDHRASASTSIWRPVMIPPYDVALENRRAEDLSPATDEHLESRSEAGPSSRRGNSPRSGHGVALELATPPASDASPHQVREERRSSPRYDITPDRPAREEHATSPSGRRRSSDLEAGPSGRARNNLDGFALNLPNLPPAYTSPYQVHGMAGSSSASSSRRTIINPSLHELASPPGPRHSTSALGSSISPTMSRGGSRHTIGTPPRAESTRETMTVNGFNLRQIEGIGPHDRGGSEPNSRDSHDMDLWRGYGER